MSNCIEDKQKVLLVIITDLGTGTLVFYDQNAASK